MKKDSHDNGIVDNLNTEYVILQTTNMNSANKPTYSKADNLALLLQESESVTYFRRFLDSINCGHFLDFWFACEGFKNFDKSDPHKLNQLLKVIYRAYIRSESPFAVPLKSNTKKIIVDKLSDRKSFDPSIFDSAQSEIRDILATEFLVKFFKSGFYIDNILYERGSISSANNNQQLSDKPASSSSSTGYISRRVTGGKHVALSRSTDTVTEGGTSKNTTDGGGAMVDSISCHLGVAVGSTSSKDRRNLSEVDPPAFAKVLTNKLEELLIDNVKFERILRLVKSVQHESDTDDSHSSAISYLMRCQLYSPREGNCCSVDGDVASDPAQISNIICKMKANYVAGVGGPSDVKDDYAQDILENHCSRIGSDQKEGRHDGRDLPQTRVGLKREKDLGSITSYDSGVATSLEQYSNMGKPTPRLDKILQLYNNNPDSVNPADLESESHRYHHHHHHHHHKNHIDYPYHKDFPAAGNVYDLSSNIDSGISSSAYENSGRRPNSKEDKVSHWISKNSKSNSKTCYNYKDSFLPSITSQGIPPNTPLISARGVSFPLNDAYPHRSYPLPRCCPKRTFSPLPESGLLPCQNIENWLDQQETTKSTFTNSESYRHDYCSSTVGVAGSELLSQEDPRGFSQFMTSKDQNFTQTSKVKLPGPLVVGYYIGNDPVPYRTQIADAQSITLGQFKSLIAKKGPFRYFFKRYCDEFECGVVHEEVTRDEAVLPLWEGKVVAKIEKLD